MNNKIPCGGFYLSDTLGVDENGKLGVNGGEPYKSLVTDGDGNVKWEDRQGYESSRVAVDDGTGVTVVKVTDDIPSWISVDSPIKTWFSNGNNVTVNPEGYSDLGNGSFTARRTVFFITTDNVEFNGVVFPEKGVYFVQTSEFYVSGIASADSDTPEITWDGNISVIKKIDPKYTGLLAFSILWDGASNYSATASYQEVRDAYDAKIPIFANLFTTDGCYPATEIAERNDTFVFHCGTYSVGYSSDGTLGTNEPS